MTKKKVCGEELDQEDIDIGVCPWCGCYLDEPCYGIESDLSDEEDEEFSL